MTLNEVGKMAGVSRMTVSRYFNGGYVSDENRRKIEKIVKETGFRPSAQAKALKTKKSETIGIVVSSLDSALLVGIINLLHEKLEEKGYQILIMRYLQSGDLLVQQINNLIARGVDGLIVSLVISDDEVKNALQRCPMPVVTFGSMKVEGVAGVVHDDQQGFSMLVKALKERGYTKIGCMAPDFESEMTKIRLEAIQEQIQKCGLQIHNEWFLECKNVKIAHYEMGCVLARQLLAITDKPQAILAVSDQIAVGAIAVLTKAGLKIPEDVAICGYGNIEVGNFLNPSITTIDLNQLDIVDKVICTLLGQIDKNEINDEKMSVKPLLILRESI